jgi:hypothetical protein
LMRKTKLGRKRERPRKSRKKGLRRDMRWSC